MTFRPRPYVETCRINCWQSLGMRQLCKTCVPTVRVEGDVWQKCMGSESWQNDLATHIAKVSQAPLFEKPPETWDDSPDLLQPNEEAEDPPHSRHTTAIGTISFAVVMGRSSSSYHHESSLVVRVNEKTTFPTFCNHWAEKRPKPLTLPCILIEAHQTQNAESKTPTLGFLSPFKGLGV